jgi:hypothetical protein
VDKPLEYKDCEPRSTLTSNGRVSIRRKRWQALMGGGVMPLDALLDAAEATVSVGARELCCQLNATAKSFRRAVVQLKRAAQLPLGESLLREIVEDDGKRVLAASESGALKPLWQAKDCKVETPAGKEVSRVYLGVDGFFVPLLTEEEKRKRRVKVVAVRVKRSAEKPKLAPLGRRKKGADQRFKEFKLVQFHDENMAQTVRGGGPDHAARRATHWLRSGRRTTGWHRWRALDRKPDYGLECRANGVVPGLLAPEQACE